ncbi:peptide chain release factor 1 [candidate division KSB1 bacterium]|nr:MAG: peptide chain release factor 1 [candidate division KSB1 bacterium]RKY81036.1 MAG: peptide chain release factor 1 [candidate division KSB1 bacterium]RKY83764.1 MAG: peptide chain release factor 1 [candidate division KSB1 bacterium]RKY88471.1 MAG: peptide chain release factor 1 [candidate division KSB1 bacterium]HDI52239.1 peptide chain release factor 1 [Bacteroidota bacterium]
MFEKLKNIMAKYEELTEQLSHPDVINDVEQYSKLSKEHSELKPIVEKISRYESVLKNIEEDEAILRSSDDAELKEIANAELEDLHRQREKLEQELKILMLPQDPLDARNIIIEIRAGTGGEEAGLFAGDLYRMYARYAERQGWKVELLDAHPQDIGGFKEIIFAVSGKAVYSKLKYEAGVHRVQRVPVTEASGRIHTSAASVVVLPEAEEVDVKIDPKDLRVDLFRASGPGGQNVNKVESAVRITHIPTGIVVSCQDEQSQHKNRAKAMKILRARLLAKKQEEEAEKLTQARRSMVSTGDRSAKIRTFNFPQNRVTDHRIGLTLYKLDQILDGDLDELIEQLQLADQAQKIEQTM